MKTNKYLYGNETPLNIPPEVIQDRIDKLDKNLTELLKVDAIERDTNRINAVVRAKAFWEKNKRVITGETMDSKAKLIKTATRYAEDSFDKQMLDLIETIKGNKKLHSQHRTMLIEYNEAHRRRLLKEEIGICT